MSKKATISVHSLQQPSHSNLREKLEEAKRAAEFEKARGDAMNFMSIIQESSILSRLRPPVGKLSKNVTIEMSEIEKRLN